MASLPFALNIAFILNAKLYKVVTTIVGIRT